MLAEQPLLEIRGRAAAARLHRAAVERVIRIMRDDPGMPLSLNDMADIAALSPYHFNRVFRAVTGVPPGEFQGALRLDMAKHLLLTTPLSVTEVCFEIGYRSLGTFTTRFTQLVGTPPRALRRLMGHVAKPDPEAAPPAVSASESGACVSGHIHAPTGFAGLIFVGLFPSPIPQSHPIGGTLLSAPGAYRIPCMPDGRYYLLVAALPRQHDPLQLLLPEGDLLVGTGEEPILVHGGQVIGNTDVTLRPADLLDPPILIALPLLLTEEVANGR